MLFFSFRQFAFEAGPANPIHQTSSPPLVPRAPALRLDWLGRILPWQFVP